MNIIPTEMTWTPDQHREFSQDRAAVRLADRILRDLERAIRRANHSTVAALAQHRAPGLPITDALRSLVGEVDTIVVALERFQDATGATLKADRDRLAPLTSEAFRRVFAGTRRLEQIDGQVRSAQQRAEDKRKGLVAAGVKGADLERLATDTTEIDALQAERAALVDEQAVLERFIKTRDESLLPAGFTVTEPIKVTARVDHAA